VNVKRLIGSAAIAGVVGASTLGIGAGVANAKTSESNSGTAVVQPADWHGYGRGRGYDPGFRGGWPINRWWHPWGWRRHW
jgi:hypothetical protein